MPTFSQLVLLNLHFRIISAQQSLYLVISVWLPLCLLIADCALSIPLLSICLSKTAFSVLNDLLSVLGNFRAPNHFMRFLGHAVNHLHQVAMGSKHGYTTEQSRSDLFMTLFCNAVFGSESKCWVDEFARYRYMIFLIQRSFSWHVLAYNHCRMLQFLPQRLESLFDTLHIVDVSCFASLLRLTRCLAIIGMFHCRWVQGHFSDLPKTSCRKSAYQVALLVHLACICIHLY